MVFQAILNDAMAICLMGIVFVIITKRQPSVAVYKRLMNSHTLHTMCNMISFTVELKHPK